MRPVAILMSGFPACGKTTTRDELVGAFTEGTFELVAPDDNIEAAAKHYGTTYAGIFQNDLIRDRCYQDAWDALDVAKCRRRNIIVDRTHLTPEHRRKTLDRIPDDYRVFCIAMDPPQVDKWVARLDAREGKEIPPAVLFSMVRGYSRPTTNEHFEWIFTGDRFTAAKGAVNYLKTHCRPALGLLPL